MKNKNAAIFLFLVMVLNSCMAHTAGNPCRDPVTGRYTTCGGSGGGSSDPNSAWYIIGGFGAFAAIAGITAAVAHAAHSREQEEQAAYAAENRARANPDSDGDGVSDGRDSCPRQHRGEEQFGTARQNWLWGCPVVRTGDTDGDGILDLNDRCPNIPRGNQLPPPNSIERLYYDSGCPVSPGSESTSSPASNDLNQTQSGNSSAGTGSTYVHGYFRSNGTYVHGYSRHGR